MNYSCQFVQNDSDSFVVAHSDYTSKSAAEISISSGDLIRVYCEIDNFWLYGKNLTNNNEGLYYKSHKCSLNF